MNTYIGYSTNIDTRYKATSGGVGTSILKYLFDNSIIQTAITFDYDSKKLKYIPRLIYNYQEYKISGSIYHEINLIKFIKENISKIKGGFACFVLPCQARPIRSILTKAGIDCFLIGLTCSSQQSLDATFYLLKRLKIDPQEVKDIQYRGNGWPSGVQIWKQNNSITTIPNNNSIWSQIFHSRLFILKQCFKCQNTLNTYSDITLADPWLKEYQEEKTGMSIICSNTPNGYEILQKIIAKGDIYVKEIDFNLFLKSQEITIKRKQSYIKHKHLISIYSKILSSTQYRKLVLNNVHLFSLHNKIKNKIENLIQ